MQNAQEIYAASTGPLPASERLRLATIILEELAQTAGSVLDYSDAWTEEDMRDLEACSVNHAATLYRQRE